MPGEAELYHRLGFDCGPRIWRVIHGRDARATINSFGCASGVR
jgi:hypothetical protein